MKKTLMFWALLALTVFQSCKKDPPQQAPTPVVTTPSVTIEQSSRLPSRTVMPTDSIVLLFEHVVKVTAVPDGSIATIILDIAGTNGLSVSSLKHVSVSIKDTHGTSKTIEGYQIGQSHMEFPIGFALADQTSIDSIQVWAKVASTVRGVLSGTEQVVCYSPTLGGTHTTDAIQAQTVTFDAPSMIVGLSSLTPAKKLVLDAVEDTALVVTFTASGNDLDLAQTLLAVTTSGILQTINVYDGTTLVGTSTVGNEFYVPVPISLTIPDGTSKTLLFKQVSKTITDGSQSRSNVKMGLARYTFRTPDGYEKTTNVSLVGNNLYLVKSYPLIQFIPESNALIVDSTERTVLHFKVTAKGGPISWKSLGVILSWGDQYPNNSLSMKNPKLLKNNVDQIGSIKFYNAIGHEDSVYSETDTRIFPTWVGGDNEDIISEGTTVDYKVLMTPNGFIPTSAGDAVVFRVPKDDSTTIAYNHLTLGPTSMGYNAKLENPNGDIVQSSFIWSDRSANDHNANGIVGSDDFFGTDLTPGFSEFSESLSR